MSVVAVIPARKNSKRLKTKNFKLFNKKPLIDWTIEASLKSNSISKVIVSTDYLEIKKEIKNYKSVYIHNRPKYLSMDTSSSEDLILHIIDEYKLYKSYKWILILQPTSPLRSDKDIEKMIKLSNEENSKSFISAYKVKYPLLKKNDKIVLSKKNSKDLLNYYCINGAMYLFDINWFKKNKVFYNSNTKIFDMPFERSIDIDNLSEFLIAEFIHNAKI